MSTKVIFETSGSLDSVTSEGSIASLVFSEKRKWRHTWKADKYLYSSCLFKRQYTGVETLALMQIMTRSQVIRAEQLWVLAKIRHLLG